METIKTVSKLESFARGELTFAELEGMTWEEAQGIARVACELADAGRLEESRILLEGLVEGNQFDSAAQAALGTVYHKLGRKIDAMAAYNRALEHDAANPVALVNRGELRIQAGDGEGLRDLVKAVEVDPKGESAASRRAQGLLKAVAAKVAKTKA